jgi:hypothetical protein
VLAKFDIVIHRDDRPNRAVRVIVHDNVHALRSAVTQYVRTHNSPVVNAAEDNVLGVCHRFHTQNYKGRGKNRRSTQDPLCAIVRLAPPDIGIGIVTHELAHAAVWIQEIDDNFRDTPLVCQNDEDFCWNLGELVRQTVNQLYLKGIWGAEVSD